jgi:hypothetical protein
VILAKATKDLKKHPVAARQEEMVQRVPSLPVSDPFKAETDNDAESLAEILGAVAPLDESEEEIEKRIPRIAFFSLTPATVAVSRSKVLQELKEDLRLVKERIGDGSLIVVYSAMERDVLKSTDEILGALADFADKICFCPDIDRPLLAKLYENHPADPAFLANRFIELSGRMPMTFGSPQLAADAIAKYVSRGDGVLFCGSLRQALLGHRLLTILQNKWQDGPMGEIHQERPGADKPKHDSGTTVGQSATPNEETDLNTLSVDAKLRSLNSKVLPQPSQEDIGRLQSILRDAKDAPPADPDVFVAEVNRLLVATGRCLRIQPGNLISRNLVVDHNSKAGTVKYRTTKGGTVGFFNHTFQIVHYKRKA